MINKLKKNLLIVGAGGHGKVVADIARLMNIYEMIDYVDDHKSGCRRVKEVISDEKSKLDCEAFIAIGNCGIRRKISELFLDNGFALSSLVHPKAVIARNVSVGCGSVFMPNSVVNVDTRIGQGVIVNTGATVDHDCEIDDYAHIAPGAHISGTVRIGRNTWIGVGAVISNNINICDMVTVGAGAVVVADICEMGTYFGVPARRYK